MSLQDKLKKANLDNNHEVTLVYTDGEDVIHAWDGYQETVIENSGIATTLAELVTSQSFKGNPVLEEMRDNHLLEDYERDHSGFADYVANVITENVYEYDWIERNTEQYDYKRGFMTVEARVKTTVGTVLNADSHTVSGWTVETSTDLGNLTIEE